MTKPLLPAAQAVRNAAGWQGTSLEREAQNIAASVLRAAALHCKRDTLILLAIADELENSNV